MKLPVFNRTLQKIKQISDDTSENRRATNRILRLVRQQDLAATASAEESAQLREGLKKLEAQNAELMAQLHDTKAQIDRVRSNIPRLSKIITDVSFQLSIDTIQKNEFWFVDIPRTSSSSIRVELGQHFGPVYAKSNIFDREYSRRKFSKDHLTAQEVCDLVGRKAWDKLFTFSVVRNPWDRTWSFYNYLLRAQQISPQWTFNEYVQRLCDEENNSTDFSYSPLRYRMVDHICDANGNLLVDEIVRYEERASKLQVIAQKLDIPALGEVHVQRGRGEKGSYREYYDSETRDLIAKKFQDDIDLFSYGF